MNVAEGDAVPIDVGRVNGRTFINVATGGFGTQVTVETPPEVKRLLGRVAYLVAGVASIGRLQARRFKFARRISSGRERPTFSLSAMAGKPGAAFKCASTALLNDGLLDLMIVPDVPYDQALALARELLAPPPHVNYQSVIYRQVPWVEISSAAGLYMNLDGEPLRPRRFASRFCPRRCAAFCRPQRRCVRRRTSAPHRFAG